MATRGIFEQNREKIIRWYIIDNISGCEIIKKLGTKNKKIYQFLRKCNVSVRSRGEARTGMKIPQDVIDKTKQTKKRRNSYNPFAHMPKSWRKRNTGKTYEDMYGIDGGERVRQKISKSSMGRKGTPQTPEQKLSHSKKMKGKNSGIKNYFWKGGIFKSKYPQEFDGQLKLKVRIRDDFKCQECGRDEKKLGYKLQVHHIDFNKNNNSIENLIGLCRNCHGKTQFKGKDWIEYYKLKMAER